MAKTQERSNITYGLDFGTSNTTIAILESSVKCSQPSNPKTLNSDNSVLFFPEREMGQCYVGKDAIHMYIANNMKGRLIQSLKSLLPDTSFTHTFIHGKKFKTQNLVSTLIRHFKTKADKAVGTKATKVVIGRPAKFSENGREDKYAEDILRIAALDSGFKNVAFQFEPIAAALSYEARLKKPELVLVGDLGAGTSDFTLMRLDPTKMMHRDRSNDIIGTTGCHIGGDDFDSEIMWNRVVPYFGYGIKYKAMDQWLDIPVHIFRHLCSWEKIAFLKDKYTQKDLRVFHHNVAPQHKYLIKNLQSLINNNLGFALFKAIEKAKIALSTGTRSKIDFGEGQFSIEEWITRSQFRHMIREKLELITESVNYFLSSLSVKEREISAVFLTGGTSLVPDVKKYFDTRFGPEKIKGGDTFTSVSKGLALSSPILFDE